MCQPSAGQKNNKQTAQTMLANVMSILEKLWSFVSHRFFLLVHTSLETTGSKNAEACKIFACNSTWSEVWLFWGDLPMMCGGKPKGWTCQNYYSQCFQVRKPLSQGNKSHQNSVIVEFVNPLSTHFTVKKLHSVCSDSRAKVFNITEKELTRKVLRKCMKTVLLIQTALCFCVKNSE